MPKIYFEIPDGRFCNDCKLLIIGGMNWKGIVIPDTCLFFKEGYCNKRLLKHKTMDTIRCKECLEKFGGTGDKNE